MHMQDLERARKMIGDDKTIKLSPSLQESLMSCVSASCIYLTEGQHSIKFLENLNNSIVGLVPCDNSIDLRLKENPVDSKQPVIAAKEFENILLTLVGDVKMKNVIFDCRKLRTGILIRDGTIQFENCTFIGDKSSTTSTAITMFENTNVSCDNCVIRDFAMAISLRGSSTKSSLAFANSIIHNTVTGIECNEGSSITFKGSKIINSTHYGVIATSGKIEANKLLLSNVHETMQHNLPLSGDCEFTNCTPHNIIIFDKSDMCLLKNTLTTTKQICNGDVNGIDGLPLEMDDCNKTDDAINDTSSEQDCSVIVVDD